MVLPKLSSNNRNKIARYPFNGLKPQLNIKADRPLTHHTLNAPCLLTDNSNGLAMVIRNYHWLNSASRVLTSTCSATLVQTGERKQTHCLTLTFDIKSQASQGQGQPSCQKSRSNGSNRRAPIDKRTDTHTWMLPNVLSPLLRNR